MPVQVTRGPDGQGLGETCRWSGSRDKVTRVDIEKSCFEKRARRFPGLGLKTGGGGWWCTWHHHGACFEMKQRREASDGIRVIRKKMDGYVPGGRWVCYVGQV